ncbi:MAG: response regulator transcription factor [Chitinophagales bacterium]|nr:response regulator transcription factor [Chitinophagales bacterium]MCO5280586.1 response regulator transcription factor [Chitinophagales bacterium]OJV28385.1 MAG: DNA-binding response regulator [Bacteroidetes bacterium 37-13]HRN94282.1 response regulator transcription factor [Chitinophagales bacterium]HRP38621.1 response regulator transcription factor [Chitinophagales bacterium]
MEKRDIKILLADDEADVLDFMKYNLERDGFEVYTVNNGIEAIESAKKHQPHIIILDLMMPKLDGILTCRELRNLPQFKNTLITFLTARDEDYSQIAGFESGADDYITKPIKPRVFISRIHALLRRLENKEHNKNISVGEIEINTEQYSVLKKGEEISLARKEFELLHLLMNKPGKVFKREEILRKVWGTETIVGDRTIDVHIRKLREKIGDNYFKTLKGIGYKFEA